MAIETADLVSKFLEAIDAVYKQESLTARLDALTQPLDFAGANAVKVLKLGAVGLGTYSRSSGYPAGDISAEWETMTLSIERGRAFSIDRMDNDETLGLVMGNLIREWMRVYVAPELDAYRFEQYYTNAGTQATPAALSTGDEVLAAIDAGISVMDAADVPAEGRLLFISNGCYSLLKGSVDRSFSSDRAIDRTIQTLDGMPVIPVPQGRFYTGIDLDAGATVDAGGYSKSGAATSINFLILHPSAVLQPIKLNQVKYFSPDVNQVNDGHLWQYRLYHDAFVYENKEDGIYGHASNA